MIVGLGRVLADGDKEAHDALPLGDLRAEAETPDGDAVCEPIDFVAAEVGVVVLLTQEYVLRTDCVGRWLALSDADADAQTLEESVDERESDVVWQPLVETDVDCDGDAVLLGMGASVVVRVPVTFALALGALDVVRVPVGAPDDETETEKVTLELVLTVVESVAGMVVG